VRRGGSPSPPAVPGAVAVTTRAPLDLVRVADDHPCLAGRVHLHVVHLSSAADGRDQGDGARVPRLAPRQPGHRHPHPVPDLGCGRHPAWPSQAMPSVRSPDSLPAGERGANTAAFAADQRRAWPGRDSEEPIRAHVGRLADLAAELGRSVAGQVVCVVILVGRYQLTARARGGQGRPRATRPCAVPGG
jgi:hypothetical protein